MSCIIHTALIVTSWDREAIQKAHAEALNIGLPVTPAGPEVTNGYQSFLVTSCGSKWGWDDQQAHMLALDEFKDWLRSNRNEDGDNRLEWVEVEYSSDNRGAEVSDSEWNDPEPEKPV